MAAENVERWPVDCDTEEAIKRERSARVVEAGWVRLWKTGRIAFAASEEVRFSRGDILVVRSERGDVLAKAMTFSSRRLLRPEDFLKVVRRLQPGERDVLLSRIRAREEEARAVFQREVKRYGLDMHLSEVEVVQNDSKIIFYFTSPGRVDFRGLVRDLAAALQTRIELRQIGVRDETRCTGGIGPCGLALCCATFLRDFCTVTIRMAKTQGLILNPQKMSGLCGRLMCCLAYEHDFYCEERKKFPKTGAIVTTPKGQGKVKNIAVLSRTVKVVLEDGEVEDFPVDCVQWAAEDTEVEERESGEEISREMHALEDHEQ